MVLGSLYGLLLLSHEVEAPKGYYCPMVKLEYFYLRVYNVSNSVPILSNSTLLSYLKVVNNSNKTIVLGSITLAIPDNVIIREKTEKRDSTVTMLVTVTIGKCVSEERKEIWEVNDTIIVYDSSATKHIPTYGHTNSLLRGYGIIYYPLDDTSYFILGGSFKRYIILGTILLPLVWVKHLDRWLNGWTYVVIDADGKVVDGKGYVEALLVLKVKLRKTGEDKYYYGSLPKGFRFPET